MAADKGENIEDNIGEEINEAENKVAGSLGIPDEQSKKVAAATEDVLKEMVKNIGKEANRAVAYKQQMLNAFMARQAANKEQAPEGDTIYNNTRNEESAIEKQKPGKEKSIAQKQSQKPPEAPTSQAGIARADQTSPDAKQQNTENITATPKSEPSRESQNPAPQERPDPNAIKAENPPDASLETSKEGLPQALARGDQPSSVGKPVASKTSGHAEEKGVEAQQAERANRLREIKRNEQMQKKAQQQQQKKTAQEKKQTSAKKNKDKIKKLTRLQRALKVLYGLSNCCSSCLVMTIIFGVLGFIWGGLAFIFLFLPIIFLGFYIRTLKLKNKIKGK